MVISYHYLGAGYPKYIPSAGSASFEASTKFPMLNQVSYLAGSLFGLFPRILLDEGQITPTVLKSLVSMMPLIRATKPEGYNI